MLYYWILQDYRIMGTFANILALILSQFSQLNSRLLFLSADKVLLNVDWQTHTAKDHEWKTGRGYPDSKPTPVDM